jgi:hypothetical protein
VGLFLRTVKPSNHKSKNPKSKNPKYKKRVGDRGSFASAITLLGISV